MGKDANDEKVQKILDDISDIRKRITNIEGYLDKVKTENNDASWLAVVMFFLSISVALFISGAQLIVEGKTYGWLLLIISVFPFVIGYGTLRKVGKPRNPKNK